MKYTVAELRNMTLAQLDSHVYSLSDELKTVKEVRIQVAEANLRRAQEILNES